jgi:hypothetical protein
MAYFVEKLGVEASFGSDSTWVSSADESFGALAPTPVASLAF